jgi:protein SCO1
MNHFLRPLFIAFLSLISACSAPTDDQPPLAGAKMGGAFTLINQDGNRVSDGDFAGRYRLIYFGYTFCPDVCPIDVGRLMQGLTSFERKDAARGANIQPIFISIDPKRDNPAALKSFVSAFHPRLIGLTGSESDIAAVAARYAIYFERGKPDAKGAYTVDHQAIAVLYDPKGAPVVIIAHDKGPETIAAELDRWVK